MNPNELFNLNGKVAIVTDFCSSALQRTVLNLRLLIGRMLCKNVSY